MVSELAGFGIEDKSKDPVAILKNDDGTYETYNVYEMGDKVYEIQSYRDQLRNETKSFVTDPNADLDEYTKQRQNFHEKKQEYHSVLKALEGMEGATETLQTPAEIEKMKPVSEVLKNLEASQTSPAAKPGPEIMEFQPLPPPPSGPGGP